MSEDRDPLLKEGFMRGIRQKWCLVFLLSGGAVLTTTVMYGIDPNPFMNFLLALGTTFIVGASASDWAKTQSARSIRTTESMEQTKRMRPVNHTDTPDPGDECQAELRNADDPSYAPHDWVREDEPADFR